MSVSAANTGETDKAPDSNKADYLEFREKGPNLTALIKLAALWFTQRGWPFRNPAPLRLKKTGTL